MSEPCPQKWHALLRLGLHPCGGVSCTHAKWAAGAAYGLPMPGLPMPGLSICALQRVGRMRGNAAADPRAPLPAQQARQLLQVRPAGRPQAAPQYACQQDGARCCHVAWHVQPKPRAARDLSSDPVPASPPPGPAADSLISPAIARPIFPFRPLVTALIFAHASCRARAGALASPPVAVGAAEQALAAARRASRLRRLRATRRRASRAPAAAAARRRRGGDDRRRQLTGACLPG